ncbi:MULTISPECIES: DNA/RNA non-specific endonuclease [Streptomycetaceae]|uniref:Bulb-type lectin domain-containing protein n=1 Tax=Streptantibioticus cattleyicolor (strain ATCC 35852 / DSM 46488 / JCM 4925 / NBRC 14057 / NRRL 8057) TaxID=1003195 RepID=F8K2Y1_STREN|nr:DNA/RNA non-specific endonuclease [Streptantibioticus cattleyicolor]AEW92467.1 hypothetical protein SCATT_00960 [Streptantibioticus cattleyicolor NRRL 8057 = DSM 46488]MYS57273.1 hypothetical protein [Streptomyces sp. SID5468]CCB72830.1 exported protein of unknown function [Streptantibioticus cattleyicolor NRRL 8057 = DSM 46488]
MHLPRILAATAVTALATLGLTLPAQAAQAAQTAPTASAGSSHPAPAHHVARPGSPTPKAKPSGIVFGLPPGTAIGPFHNPWSGGWRLGDGSRRASPDGRTWVDMNKGTFEVRINGNIEWTAPQANAGGAYLAFQFDGNLVVYNRADQPIWASNTTWDCGNQGVGCLLNIQNDGNVVIYQDLGFGVYQSVWATGTRRGPQADCLEHRPGGAVDDGHGWLTNTTQPVPQRNKTTVPPGPPGTRAAMARACLRNPPGEGSVASGDITGLQDAQKFVAAHAPGAVVARCHLIANVLGGKGQVRDGGQANLVPCWQVGMNTGTPSMRTYEQETRRAIKGLGGNDAIFYEVTPDYLSSTSTIPYGVTMSATVERANGTRQQLFGNIVIPNTQASSGLNLGN